MFKLAILETGEIKKKRRRSITIFNFNFYNKNYFR